MSLFKKLFGSQKPAQELRGVAIEPDTDGQKATRERMEAELAHSKELRDSKAADKKEDAD